MTVLDLAEQFLEWKFNAGGPELRRYYQKHLRRFTKSWMTWRLETIRARHLHLLVMEMQKIGLAPKTVNHDIIAVKGMLRWAMDLEYMPVMTLEVVKTLPTGPPPDKSLAAARVRSIILDELDPKREQPWAAINYLCAMRPSEVVRVVQGDGRWLEPGAEAGFFELDRGKMDFRTRQKRVILFSEEALEWLGVCRRIWSRLDSYSTVVRAACGVGPSRFRHSAAKHLHWAGVPRGDVDLLLGHVLRGVTLTYTPIDHESLRAKISLLSLRSSPAIAVPDSASSA
jgi:integrase